MVDANYIFFLSVVFIENNENIANAVNNQLIIYHLLRLINKWNNQVVNSFILGVNSDLESLIFISMHKVIPVGVKSTTPA